MIIRRLLESDQDVVYQCFLEAFSDYAVPMRPARAPFEEMLRRRGYCPEVSVAAFDEGRMVGIHAQRNRAVARCPFGLRHRHGRGPFASPAGNCPAIDG